MSKANFLSRQLDCEVAEFSLSSTNKVFYQHFEFVSAEQFKTLVSFLLLPIRRPEEKFRKTWTFSRSRFWIKSIAIVLERGMLASHFLLLISSAVAFLNIMLNTFQHLQIRGTQRPFSGK